MDYNVFFYLSIFLFILWYINYQLITQVRCSKYITRNNLISFLSFIPLLCSSLVFIYMSGYNNDFNYYSPGSDSDLFISFLKAINSGQNSYIYEVFASDNKNGYLNIISPVFNFVEPGSLLAISLLLILNLLFVAMIAKRIVSLSCCNDKVIVQWLIVLCPLTAMLMVSYLRDIFALFLVVEIVYLIHTWRASVFNIVLLCLLSVVLYYTRSFYLLAIFSGLVFSCFKFKYAITCLLISFILIFLFVDLKPILVRLLVLHGEDAARLGESSLNVAFDDIDSISPLIILKRIVLGGFTMLVTPQPAFILKDIIGARGGFNLIENFFQFIYSVVYIVFLVPITLCLITSISRVKFLLFKNSRFHFILLFVLSAVFFVYSIKFFGIRHYKVEYVKYILWLGAISFFPIVSHLKTKRFFCLSMFSSLLALLITVKYLY